MIEPRQFMRAGAAASVVGHMAVLYVGLMFANARPFAYTPSETIAIDIVTPEEAKELPKPAEPPKPPDSPDQKQPDPIDFSALTAPIAPTPPLEPPSSQPAQKRASQKAATAARPAPPPATAAQPSSTSQQASASQQAVPAQQATISPGAEALQPAPSQPAAPSPPTAEPDITVKYGVMLGLPAAGGSGDFDAPAIDTAKIATDNIAAFRRHLKSCSSLPAQVAPTDKVRIVLRVLLTRDGRLAAEPALIEASASAKGPLLMQKAMDALQACQPYAMLPADRYNEWKVLDLAFTPQDFVGG